MSEAIADLLAALPAPTALVCGAGGLNATAQAGMLAALGPWRPDLGIGSSGGAVTTACLTADDAAEFARDCWTRIAASGLTEFGWTRLTGAVTGREQSRLGKQWRALFHELFGDRRWPDDGRLSVVATNVTTGRAAMMSTGLIAESLIAATAFPVLAPPVERGGDILVDGGFAAPLPVLPAVAAGAASIVALDTGRADADAEPVAPTRWYDVVLASMQHQMAANAAHDVAVAAAQVPVLLLSVPDPFRVRWSELPMRISMGERSAVQQLEELAARRPRFDVPGVYTAAAQVRADRRLAELLR